ncbi:polymer-forming cytoskeletal protein [Massilia pinisoli]|uniref:Polymer-forming cytoskeletal protein n=1 Tax=Massilia pinisoli TaxID=1772194 RepID=A0ABT1ZJI9_9BURK|nr:polymer-forming cytoskeletal protein [Massilia pinisoli]MCS0580063.1 polymer-forming cytoskeletal protein [Massilia pinisoli]
MLLRRLHSLLIAFMLFAAGGRAAAGTTYTFGGNATVGSCTLAGATYTCAALPLTQWDDSMIIASGYTVKITSNVSFESTQHLAMSGSAVLSSTGDLDIGGIKGSNLNIASGTLVAGKTFTVGSQTQDLTANIQAGYAKLGSGSTLTINGNVTATGNVDIASHATITGAITGAAVTAASGVSLYGNITGSKSFTLGSGNTVVGDITAPVVNLLPSDSNVTGNITATTSLELGSSVRVKGNVVTGTLTEDSSEAIIDGNATVDSAVLQWHGRVTQTIYCTGGTATGKCDCVTNNSGYQVNTASGPHCEGKTVPLDHFTIGYDKTASVCAPAKVTVTACANAACTATYGGGASVTLAPTGQTVAVPASGVVQADVAYTQAGTNVLAISSPSTPTPTVCWRNGDAAPGADCQVNVVKSGYLLTPARSAFFAENQVQPDKDTLTLAAVRYDDTSKACVPIFGNVSRNVTFTCGYAKTATPGILPVRLNGIALNATQNTGAACDGTGRTMSLTFDANGKATFPIQYADAGQVTVTATDNGPNSPGSATATPIFVPVAFRVGLGANSSYVAGDPFTAIVTAVNGLGATTRKFGTESPAESAVLAAVGCQPSNGNGLLGKSSTISGGVQTFALTWSEVGTIDLAATLANSDGYLSSGVRPAAATTNTAGTGCTGAAGRFIPAYFKVTADPDWKRTLSGGTQLQYYSGEPAMKVTVTAYNRGNGVTYNYAGGDARDVTFAAFDTAGSTPVGNGRFSRSATYPVSDTTGKAQLRANDFVAGVGTWTGSYTFTTSPTAPTRVRVRATDTDNASSAAAEPVFMVRSGRVHIANAYGNTTGLLRIPVNIEFYTGQTWVRNYEDTTTTFASTAVSLGRTLNAIAVTLTPFANGAATLGLTPAANSAGASVPFAINLGAPVPGANTSCYYVAAAGTAQSSMVDSTGAGLPFLRSADPSCGKTNVDPSAMATFGIFAPETKRIIHMREVYR